MNALKYIVGFYVYHNYNKHVLRMEEAIRHYFKKNYKYSTILQFLEKFHNIKLSKRTLIRKLQEYGLGRRKYNANRDQVEQAIQQELNGSGRLLGYRAM